MSKDEVILTQEGLEQLQAELDDLKYVKRKELAARIKLAISYGDLKENSEYHSAKNDQSFMETRILILDKMLKKARVIEAKSLDLSKVSIGLTVILNDIEFSEKIEYKIVIPVTPPSPNSFGITNKLMANAKISAPTIIINKSNALFFICIHPSYLKIYDCSMSILSEIVNIQKKWLYKTIKRTPLLEGVLICFT